MPRAAPEKLNLAEALLIDPRTLRNWEKKDGFPVGGTLEQIVQWRDKHGLGRKGNNDLAAIKIDIAKEQLRKIQRENESAEGKFAPIADVRAYLANTAAKFDQMLTQKIDVEAPARLVGKDIVAARAECQQIHDEMRETVNAGLSSYEPQA